MLKPLSISSLADLADPLTCPRLVIKVGSSLLVDSGGARPDWLAALVGEIAAARTRGQDIIIVSSGAIALGAFTFDDATRPISCEPFVLKDGKRLRKRVLVEGGLLA